MGFTQFARKLVIFVFDSYFLVFFSRQRFVCDPPVSNVLVHSMQTQQLYLLGLTYLLPLWVCTWGYKYVCTAYN